MPSRVVSRLIPIVLLAARAACGQDDPPPELVTDRPDQTESTATVPPGYVQIETGFTHAQRRQGIDAESDSALETLLRAGLMRDLELRLGMAGYTWAQEDTPDGVARTSGWGDTEMGFKLRLWDERGALPDAALLAGVSLPSGARGFTSDRLDPAFRFSFSHTLTERLSLGYNVGAAWTSALEEDGATRASAAFQYTATLGYGVTDRLGAFIEAFGDAPFDSGAPAHSLDGGFTYLIRDNLQADLAIGAGLSKAADDWFISVGLSYRFPR